MERRGRAATIIDHVRDTLDKALLDCLQSCVPIRRACVLVRSVCSCGACSMLTSLSKAWSVQFSTETALMRQQRSCSSNRSSP